MHPSSKPQELVNDSQPKPGSCPICGGQAQFWLAGEDSFYNVSPFTARFSRCSSCGYGFIEKLPSSEEIATFYPKGYWLEQKGMSLIQRMEQFYIRFFLVWDVYQWVKRAFPHVAKWDSFLDIGCSRGDLAALVKKNTARVLGLEMDPGAAEFARQTFHLEVLETEIEQWEPDEQFEVVCAFHVLEHVRHPQRVLKTIYNALKPRGRCVIRVPNIGSLQARSLKSKWKGLEIPRHLSHFTETSLVKLLERSHFRILRKSTWALRDGPPGWTSSLFRRGEPTWQSIHDRPNTLFKLAYLALNTVLTPWEWVVSRFGHGGMITVIVEKEELASSTEV